MARRSIKDIVEFRRLLFEFRIGEVGFKDRRLFVRGTRTVGRVRIPVVQLDQCDRVSVGSELSGLHIG